MEMLLKAIQQRSFSRNIAQPVVITRSGEKATFLAGGEVPIVAAASATTNANQSATVTYKPFGILFNVTPVLQNDGSIWLKLELEVSDVSEYLSFQNVPGFVSRKINTNIILKDNNYALLSGLVQSKNSKNVDRFPILSNIPIIGEIFKSRRFKDDDSELWIAVSAMRSDQQNDDIDIKKFIEKKAFHYQNLLTGSLLD
jgi:pilus assembly protein CpaC